MTSIKETSNVSNVINGISVDDLNFTRKAIHDINDAFFEREISYHHLQYKYLLLFKLHDRCAKYIFEQEKIKKIIFCAFTLLISIGTIFLMANLFELVFANNKINGMLIMFFISSLMGYFIFNKLLNKILNINILKKINGDHQLPTFPLSLEINNWSE